MIRTQISMTEEQAVALRRMSVRRKTSQAALLREALDQLVVADDRATRVERARRAIGVGRSGTTSTSVDHDAALDEAFTL